MKFLKGSFKTLASYTAGVFLFTFFLIAPLSMENNMNTWIAMYSLVFFIFTVIFLYKQVKKTGEYDRIHVDAKQTVLRGLVYGLVGFAPYLILELVYFTVYTNIDSVTSVNILHAVFRCGFGPMYFIIRFLGYTWYSYAISSVIIPLVSFLGYAAGLSGKNLGDMVVPGKKDMEDFLND